MLVHQSRLDRVSCMFMHLYILDIDFLLEASNRKYKI